MVMVGKTHGKGSIWWDSADPHAQPHIKSALLDDEVDRAVAVEALQHCYEVANAPAARKIAKPIYPAARTLRDRDRLDDKIRVMCDSGYHPCGTVQMGEKDTPCDPQGRVRGTERLRVVDASLIPTIPHANIHLSVLMMAERIAEWL
jgi:choline dehydrogenase